MKLNWKTFYIDLNKFYLMLQDNVPNSDGIIADDIGFEIIPKQPLTQAEKNIIQNYYDNLNEEEELVFKNKQIEIKNKIEQAKLNLLTKKFDDLTIQERKLWLGIELTKEDIESL